MDKQPVTGIQLIFFEKTDRIQRIQASCDTESGWPDQNFKNQKIFSQNQKRSERFFEKSETNQKKKFPVKWSVLC